MEETTPIIEQPTQQPTTQPADNGKQGSERTFTQQEVDRIIKERLARERAKAAPQEPTEAEKKESELTARETRLDCRAYLLDRGYSPELLDILGTSDLNEFKKAADAVHRLVHESAQQIVGPAPLYDNTPPTVDVPVTGFEHGRKHTPRQIRRYSTE